MTSPSLLSAAEAKETEREARERLAAKLEAQARYHVARGDCSGDPIIFERHYALANDLRARANRLRLVSQVNQLAGSE